MQSARIVALTLAFFAAVPATAQTAPDPAGKPAANDPNRMKCVVEEETGSRLGRKRICMTVAQWDEQRRRQRMDIESSQRNRTRDMQ